MGFWKGIAAAFSTYSAVPMPRFDWDEGTPGQALFWFPAVGLACGGALWGWHALCRALDGGELLVEGRIDGLEYASERERRRGFLGKLMG